MMRFEKKAPPRQASDLGPDPLSRFFNHGIRRIHGKGAPILVGPVSVRSVCSPAVATCRRSHLSPDGGSFTRHAPPLGSGWLRFDSRWLRCGNQPGWGKALNSGSLSYLSEQKSIRHWNNVAIACCSDSGFPRFCQGVFDSGNAMYKTRTGQAMLCPCVARKRSHSLKPFRNSNPVPKSYPWIQEATES